MGIGNICPPLDPQVAFLVTMIQLANKNRQCQAKYNNLLKEDRSILEEMISLGQHSKKNLGLTTVEVLPYKAEGHAETPKEGSSNPVKLILRDMYFDPSNSTREQSKRQREQFYLGCIVFANAYYIGQMTEGKAHGKGVLYFNSYQQYEVAGYWENDSLKRGEINRWQSKEGEERMLRKQLEVELLNGEEEAIVRMSNQMEYRGSIKLGGLACVESILTGRGTIKYTDGAVYRGEIRNGLYETTNQEGQYTKPGEYSFRGKFKGGLRQGRGFFTIFGKQKCSLSLDFDKGVPVGAGLVSFPGHNISHLIEVVDKGIVIGSRLSEIQQQ